MTRCAIFAGTRCRSWECGQWIVSEAYSALDIADCLSVKSVWAQLIIPCIAGRSFSCMSHACPDMRGRDSQLGKQSYLSERT